MNIGGGLEGIGSGSEYMKGITLYDGNEEGMEVGGKLRGSEWLGIPTLRGMESCVEVIMRGGTYIGMLGRVLEIGIERSMVVEGGVYPKS